MSDKKTALVVGVTGIVGLNLATVLLREKWRVYGLSRRHRNFLPAKLRHISVDLTEADECNAKLTSLRDVTHVFYATVLMKTSEADTCDVNVAMIKNLFDNLPLGFEHFALVTGTKHYMGSFEDLAQKVEKDMETPYVETLPRQPGKNFYYSLEDVLFEKAAELGFTWSVVRPPVVIGYAPGNQMNMFSTIAVYAALCKYTGEPFVYPGTEENYLLFEDPVDAETILAEHLIWQATNPSAANQAFNVSNGDVIRWKTLWPKIAEYFQIEAVGPRGEQPMKLEEKMAGMGNVWKEMASKFGLKNDELSEITTWWLFSANSARKFSTLSNMTKSREMGFLKYQCSEKSIFQLFDRLKAEKIIP